MLSVALVRNPKHDAASGVGRISTSNTEEYCRITSCRHTEIGSKCHVSGGGRDLKLETKLTRMLLVKTLYQIESKDILPVCHYRR